MQLFASNSSMRHPRYFARWAVEKPGQLVQPRHRELLPSRAVRWFMKDEPASCADHLELSGFGCAAILSYGKDRKGILRVMRHITIPGLRKKPNNTSSSFSCNFTCSPDILYANKKKQLEYPDYADVKGTLRLLSHTQSGLTVEREFYPAMHAAALIEAVTVKNPGNQTLHLQVYTKPSQQRVLKEKYCVGNTIRAFSGCTAAPVFQEGGNLPIPAGELRPGGQIQYFCVYSASDREEPVTFSLQEETDARRSFIGQMFSDLTLESGNPMLDAQFSHCVLRGSESIYRTKNGLMHGPGGGNYYAALWTNDQCEYANPFFPFSGYQPGIEQAINCYRLYENYMDRSDLPMEKKRPLVTSIVAEGADFWNGAGDRGDGAMYAYGLARFLLAMGDKQLMKDFYPALAWCLDFTLSRKTAAGVYASDADELENRFPSGDANLYTACLMYDALENSSQIADILEDQTKSQLWRTERRSLTGALEHHFGAEVEGYPTYRYYDGNTKLRSWICMPLTVELFDRKKGTIDALYSPKLYKNGLMRTVSNHITTWDRSLLFALRGTLLAGEAEKGTEVLLQYCQNRLLGRHAPYPFEAFPEGNRAHLAAESILFARVVTEGLFGLLPTGYRKLRIRPQLSTALPELTLKGLCLFGQRFDITARQEGITLIWEGHTYQTPQKEAVFDFTSHTFS